MKIVLLRTTVSSFSKDFPKDDEWSALFSKLIQETQDCCGYPQLPEVGKTYCDGILKVYPLLSLTPNPSCRKGEIIVSYIRGGLRFVKCWQTKPETTIYIEGYGSPDSWGQVYETTYEEINNFLLKPIEEVLSSHYRRVCDIFSSSFVDDKIEEEFFKNVMHKSDRYFF